MPGLNVPQVSLVGAILAPAGAALAQPGQGLVEGQLRHVVVIPPAVAACELVIRAAAPSARLGRWRRLRDRAPPAARRQRRRLISLLPGLAGPA